MDVGVRELRDRLKHWLEAARRGDEVTVTERGKPIARLIGVSSPPALERLIAQGVVTRANRPRRQDRVHLKVKATGTVSDLVSEQRR